MRRRKVRTVNSRRKRGQYVYQGIEFASRAEMEFAINELNKSKLLWMYEPEKFPWIPEAEKRTYTPDFKVQRKDGSYFYIEYKGFFKYEDRKKMLAIKAQYPDCDIRMVFMRPQNTIGANSKTTYGEWCDKNGILWADNTLPKEWLRKGG